MKFIKVPGSFFALFATSLLIACGGGGGGGDSFVGAGNISVSVSPETIDTGDRVKVTANFNELHPDGVSIKFRYPDGLQYIPDTAIWTVKGKNFDTSPAVETAAEPAQQTFLVYYLGRNILGDNNSGELEFELRGVSSTNEKSVIEVDIDVLESDPIFSADSPEFTPEDATRLRVR